MSPSIPPGLKRDLEVVQRIPGIPAILELICHCTGMGFSAVARVTSEHWLACRVRDEIQFGLTEGGELKVETTICSWIRDHKSPVVFNDIKNEEYELYRSVAAMYGFTSYISYPILLSNGSFFGTLCAIDPRPLKVEEEIIRSLFAVFAEWISFPLQQLEMNEAFHISAKEMFERLEQAYPATSQPRVGELIGELRGLIS
jgi:GAF domain-containing protein